LNNEPSLTEVKPSDANLLSEDDVDIYATEKKEEEVPLYT
jgi:hypothetical protein